MHDVQQNPQNSQAPQERDALSLYTTWMNLWEGFRRAWIPYNDLRVWSRSLTENEEETLWGEIQRRRKPCGDWSPA